jgi:exonuclease III
MNSTPTESLRIMHHNCRSTKHLALYLAAYAHDHKLDIIALNETRLAPRINFSIPSYTSHRKDRDTRGGGCCLLVKQGIDADDIDLSAFPGAEAVAVAIQSTDRLEPLIIASIYNPPSSPIDIQLLEHLAGLSSRVLIIGDLNSHHRMWLGRTDDANGKLIEEFIDDHDFVIGNDNTFTRHPDNATGMPSIIDLAVISRDLYRQTKSTWVDTTENFTSDHYPLHVELAFKAITRKPEKHEVKILNWKKLIAEAVSAFSLLPERAAKAPKSSSTSETQQSARPSPRLSTTRPSPSASRATILGRSLPTFLPRSKRKNFFSRFGRGRGAQRTSRR